MSGRACPVAPGSPGSTVCGGAASGDLVDRLDERLDRDAAGLVAVEAALAHVARRKAAAGPDVAGVGFAVGLEHGHPPLLLAQLDRPVE
jgi:hypothetical protein